MNIATLLEVEQPASRAPQFWFYIRKLDLGIDGFGPVQETNAAIDNIAADTAQLEKFILGTENIDDWMLGRSRQLVRKSELSNIKYNRTDILQIQELPLQEVQNPHISLHLDSTRDIIKLYYYPDTYDIWSQSIKLYFTKSGDPSYLKQTFQLDANILNAIAAANGIANWPNPIEIPVDGVGDLSIFTQRSDLIFSVRETPSDETPNY